MIHHGEGRGEYNRRLLCEIHHYWSMPGRRVDYSAGLGVDDVMGALKMQDKTLQDRTMTDKRSTMPE